MRRSKRDFQVIRRIEGSRLIIEVSGTVTLRIIDGIIEQIAPINMKMHRRINELILDLSNVKYIKLSGALALLCVCSSLMSKKIRNIDGLVHFQILRPPSNVLSYLLSIGFFTQMIVNAGLLGCEDLARLESKKKEQYIAKKEPVLPISIIAKKEVSFSAKDFGNSCYQFINAVHDTFKEILLSSLYNFTEDRVREFSSANGELFENVYEHSETWGLGVIYPDRNNGTNVCYYDIGVGIKESLNSSPKAGKEFDRFQKDCEAIKYALVERHSSKLKGNGRGLSVVQDFVFENNGTIAIRSGNCLMWKKSGHTDREKEWEVETVQRFPGTQINFFIPYVGV